MRGGAVETASAGRAARARSRSVRSARCVRTAATAHRRSDRRRWARASALARRVV